MAKNKKEHSFFLSISLIEIVILCLIAVSILLIWTGNFSKFIKYSYNSYSFLILLIIIIEYIILKGRDRSRIYLIQIEHLKKTIAALKNKIIENENKITSLEAFIKGSEEIKSEELKNKLTEELGKIKDIFNK